MKTRTKCKNNHESMIPTINKDVEFLNGLIHEFAKQRWFDLADKVFYIKEELKIKLNETGEYDLKIIKSPTELLKEMLKSTKN